MHNQPGNEIALRLSGVSRSYIKGRESIRVLQGLDLEVRRGEMVSIMGPSGSGKSTLLDVIAGVTPPDAGVVELAGTQLAGMKESFRTQTRARHIGFIFQFYCLIPTLTAEENVVLPLHLWKLARRERTLRAEAALEVVGMSHRREHFPDELSGGEQQRIAIARAIAGNPDILLCDEPTGDLNRETGLEIMDVIRQLSQQYGKAVVVVTHDPDVAAMADQRFRLHNGALVDARPEHS